MWLDTRKVVVYINTPRISVGARYTSRFGRGRVCHCVVAPASLRRLQCSAFSSSLVVCLCCCRLLLPNRQRTVCCLVVPLFPELEACCFSFRMPVQRQVPRFRCTLSMGRRISLFVPHQLNRTTRCAGCILIFLIFLWKARYFGEQPKAA